MNATHTPEPGASWPRRWQRLRDGTVRAFHAYASWLVGISWRRFIVLSLLLVIVMAIVHDMPPFTWTVTHEVADNRPVVIRVPGAPKPPTAPQRAEPRIQVTPPEPGGSVEISIGRDGVRIGPAAQGVERAASAAGHSARNAQRAASSADSVIRELMGTLPPGTAETVREALKEARLEAEAAAREAEAATRTADAMEELIREYEAARSDAKAQSSEFPDRAFTRTRTRTVRYGIGEALMQFTLLWIAASAILKFTYKGTQQAQKQAARATETAEAESLKRQVVEARMAAMQAQVEPHFLFNTLASIDHLIETDPARASQMQKNLIALLRASMPTLREATGGAGGNGVRELGREIAVIRPYLEILKVRMEERLTTEVAVPEGLLSAEFPPMMLQTLVENAIKHGLEPKAEGGHLRVAAEIVHGKLQMTVADTGLGFGKAATAGTGVGLANIRERLQLLYGSRATLTVAENQPSGTVVTITVPYKIAEEVSAAAAAT
ncbi:MAG: sensor histidine kinase [Betaproteobacteria bacterium]